MSPIPEVAEYVSVCFSRFADDGQRSHTHTHTHMHTQLKNMISALHSSRQEGAKDFMKQGSHFGRDTIVSVYKAGLYRAKHNITRRVPALR